MRRMTTAGLLFLAAALAAGCGAGRAEQALMPESPLPAIPKGTTVAVAKAGESSGLRPPPAAVR